MGFENGDECVVPFFGWKSGRAGGGVSALEERVRASNEMFEIF